MAELFGKVNTYFGQLGAVRLNSSLLISGAFCQLTSKYELAYMDLSIGSKKTSTTSSAFKGSPKKNYKTRVNILE